MAAIARIRVEWVGTVGPGVSTFYCPDTDVSTAHAGVRTFFDTIKTQFPSGISFSFPNAGDLIETATGQLTGSWTAATQASVQGTAAGSARAAGVGLRVQWRTGMIAGGRRISGSTFLTDLTTTVYEANGTLASATVTSVSAAGAALVGLGVLGVWSRPRNGFAAFTQWNGVLVPDRVSTLRSRRY